MFDCDDPFCYMEQVRGSDFMTQLSNLLLGAGQGNRFYVTAVQSAPGGRSGEQILWHSCPLCSMGQVKGTYFFTQLSTLLHGAGQGNIFYYTAVQSASWGRSGEHILLQQSPRAGQGKDLITQLSTASFGRSKEQTLLYSCPLCLQKKKKKSVCGSYCCTVLFCCVHRYAEPDGVYLLCCCSTLWQRTSRPS